MYDIKIRQDIPLVYILNICNITFTFFQHCFLKYFNIFIFTRLSFSSTCMEKFKVGTSKTSIENTHTRTGMMREVLKSLGSLCPNCSYRFQTQCSCHTLNVSCHTTVYSHTCQQKFHKHIANALHRHPLSWAMQLYCSIHQAVKISIHHPCTCILVIPEHMMTTSQTATIHM